MAQFNASETGIDGLMVIEPTVFEDERGYFMETYSERAFEPLGIHCKFVQDNQSKSSKGVLRGLHFQIQHPQAKLVRVVSGTVWDVAVDLRRNSPTFGRWYGVELSSENKRQFFIPRGFAHGFVVLSPTAEFTYKCDDFYAPGDEGGLKWDDPSVGIEWPLTEGLLLSEKDQHWPSLEEVRQQVSF